MDIDRPVMPLDDGAGNGEAKPAMLPESFSSGALGVESMKNGLTLLPRERPGLRR